jgi:tRNA/rRNA methyltransferase
MHNMGFEQLRLVDPRCEIGDESYRLAQSGSPILDKARICRSVSTALRGLQLVVGTTAKTGGNRNQAYTPRQLAPQVIAHAAGQKAGILFGPEDTGLVDEDLLYCQLLVRIPTQNKARSINLAQAVLIVCYEVYLASLVRRPERVPRLAPAQQIEAMYDQLERALLGIGFLHPQNARHMMFALRRLFGRAGLEKADVGILRGIARQVAWCAGKTKSMRDQN